MTVEYYGDYVPNEMEITDTYLFAANVREFYSQINGWPKVDLTLIDKTYYSNKHNNYD